ncbi:MAG: bifunctional biotin--[acetyl-CoA-carboxylase] ligase/biotin operon repressor BirA [Methylovulum sp.]|uniref:bifunctional biotin--[acetyl-CoA-carboxylase] ligase/biotin operon repressor BirA n=1 Tax=Methylovulum sp. TaxID=1916980 RepID=UPI00262AC8D6|nr:bifunctional biotin--[acetyl-CoA-carboxylase] ligase/biotin operon repressor BirA [Methylovulum sp.]MDD2723718.1 bifunctional biotin--[acetyl-CoA-carboxylase] ligase/biotin operon repressor BirA [Methylovulum sp.]MDD5123308.1 bifunctional biotin--[acetyl-CoA-carboxylase] ligase/biotin operon repressor BirA [Methylovulum sp.]
MAISDKQKAILKVLADGEFHSGTELADSLGVSRSAVWKQLAGLADLGLQHLAVRGKGYRLEKPLELLCQTEIFSRLNSSPQRILQGLEIHDQIDSTNAYLAQLAQLDSPSGTVCFAEHQTAGKGRRGRQWASPFGSNLYLSILWRFPQGYASTSGLSLAMGVAVIRALQEQQIHPVGLKWPNDIISSGKKLGGILIEVSGESEGPCTAVIGLGLNLFLPDAAAQGINQAWTDVSKIQPNRVVSRNQLAASLLNHALALLADFEMAGMKDYLQEWRQYDCLQGQAATLFVAGQPYQGIVQGIDENGLLLLQHPDGKVQAFASGEVSFSPTSS